MHRHLKANHRGASCAIDVSPSERCKRCRSALVLTAQALALGSSEREIEAELGQGLPMIRG
jgi:hypothetical protein